MLWVSTGEGVDWLDRIHGYLRNFCAKEFIEGKLRKTPYILSMQSTPIKHTA